MRAAFLAALLLAACSETESGPDASADLACTHFRNVAADAGAGILAYDELREKLQEVYDDARYSEEPGIAEGAERMLADATAVSGTLPDSMRAFADACSAIGL